jgi:hypothetical protein
MRKWIRIKPAILITFIPAKMEKNQPAITAIDEMYGKYESEKTIN